MPQLSCESSEGSRVPFRIHLTQRRHALVVLHNQHNPNLLHQPNNQHNHRRLQLNSNMEGLHDTAPSTKSQKSTSTSIQEPAPSSGLIETSQASNTSSSVAHKLIGTTELCEQILGYFSCAELCRAKRVCRTFREVIDHSLMLQRHLFLAPCTEAIPEGSIKTDDEWHMLYDFHPILAFDGVPNPQPGFHTVLGFDGLQNPQSDFQIQLQPSQSHEPTAERWIRCYTHGPSSTLNRLTQTFGNPSGVSDQSSLRKMYLSNLPIKDVRMSFWNFSRQCVTDDLIYELSSILYCDSLSSDKGVTFGDIFEWAEKLVGQQLKMAEGIRPASNVNSLC